MKSIEVNNLVKSYGDVRAVRGISFAVEEGAFFALLGPNGAGKSTTVEILATLLAKDEGTVSIMGETLDRDDAKIRRHLGVVFQYGTLDNDLTVRENLAARGAFYGLSGQALQTRIAELDKLIDFTSYLDRRIRTLSGGQRRKAEIARALLHQPRVLMLDEPTTGLDPKSRKDIWALVLSIKKDTAMTILLTTHYMEEVLDADHVVILHEGVIRAEDSAENLRLAYARDTLKIMPKQGLLKKLDQDGVAYERINATVHVPLKNPFEGVDLVGRHREAIESFEIVKASMDDVFLNITGASLEEGTS